MCGQFNEPTIGKTSQNDCVDASREARMNSDISIVLCDSDPSMMLSQ